MASKDIRLPVDTAKRLLKNFPDQRVVVLGDVMLDRFLRGKASRLCPEAPVPVVRVAQETHVPGGAGNVVQNILALGGRASLVSVIGDDAAGSRLMSELEERGAGLEGMVTDPQRPTTQKIRVIAEHQHVVRVDRESSEPFSASQQEALVRRTVESLSGARALILSDYGKGILTPSVLSRVIAAARKARVPVIVDPKVEHFKLYQKVTCLTPNLQEAFGGMRMPVRDDDASVEALGKLILARLKAESLLITRGERGMTLFEAKGRVLHIATQAQEVFDVTGAGDTVVSVLSLALAAGASLKDAALLSNAAAGIVVGKLGTATTDPAELSAAVARRSRRGPAPARRRP